LDLDDAEVAREELTKLIKTVSEQKEVESPISVAVDLTSLTKSSKPEERQMADLVKSIGVLQNMVNGLVQTVNGPGFITVNGSLYSDRQGRGQLGGVVGINPTGIAGSITLGDTRYASANVLPKVNALTQKQKSVGGDEGSG
jgi:hypothetical protein